MYIYIIEQFKIVKLVQPIYQILDCTRDKIAARNFKLKCNIMLTIIICKKTGYKILI